VSVHDFPAEVGVELPVSGGSYFQNIVQPMDEKKQNPTALAADEFHLRIVAAHRVDFFSSVAFSPDGRWLASGSFDSTVKVWDRASGKPIRSFQGHQSKVRTVAFSPDGRWLASGSDDNTVKVWDPATGKPIRSLQGHQGGVNSVAFSPDGQWLASGSDDRTIMLWDSGSRKLIRSLKGHQKEVNSVAFSPDGRCLASVSDDDTVKVWDPISGKLIRSFEGHQSAVFSVTFSPDGRWLASGSDDKTVKVWDSASGQLPRSLEGHQDWVRSVVFSPDGRWLASGSFDKTVKVWDLASGRVIRSLAGHQGVVLSVAFSPDGRWLASGSDDKTVKVWDSASGQLLRSIEGHQDGVRSAIFSPDGRWLASGSADSAVKVWSPARGKLMRPLEGNQSGVLSLTFSPDGRWLASGSDDRTVKVWDSATGQLIRSLEHRQGWVSCLISCLSFSPDGKWLACGSDDKTVKVWDLASGQLLRSLEGHQDWVGSVVFSPDGRWLASGSYDTTVRLWDLATGKLLRSLDGHQSVVRAVAFSPDGRWLASGSDDDTVKVGDPATGRLLRSLEGHRGGVHSVIFSPDGRWLASCSDDNTVKLWDVETGAEVLTWRVIPPTHDVLTAEFLPRMRLASTFEKNLTRLGETDLIVSVVEYAQAVQAPTEAPASYVSAKVVLIGESNVGKSCLALRMATGDYRELGTTHGMRTWKMRPEQLDPGAAAPAAEEREVFVWDLGGQQEYRLVNQLFLPETTLAMILFDPTRGRAAFEDVRDWNLRLKKQTDKPGVDQRTIKLLVGTKLDTGDEVIDRAEIDRLIHECGFVDYFPTSALTPRGLVELGKAVLDRIGWDGLSKTTRPRLFQLIRETVRERQDSGEVVMLYSELEKRVRERAENNPALEFDSQSVNTVIGQLAGQGEIVETRLSSGDRVLVLQIGFISIYAGALILAARDNPKGVPALEELLVVSGRMPLPGIKPEERADPLHERVVLECTVQLLLDRGLCFKHKGLLIFPTEFKQLEAPEGERAARTVTIYYDFTGAIDNIWASLVTQLAIGGEAATGFGRVRLWKNHAELERPGQGVCGLSKIDRQSGSAHLDLMFSEEVSTATRDLFIGFVDEHLRREGVEIKEGWKMVCANGHPFDEDAIKARIADGKKDIGCPICDSRVLIGKSAEEARAATRQELLALKTSINRIKKRAIEDTKSEFDSLGVFISYSHGDEPLRQELTKHLSALRRENVVGFWHDRMIGAGEEWRGEIDRHLEQAGIILLLVSPDFIASDYCYDIETKRALERHAAGEAVVIPIVLRPVDWLKTPMAELQSLPRDNRAVTLWENRDAAFVEIANGIRQAVEQLMRPSEAPEAATAALRFIPKQIQHPPARILHLSDLHFSAGDDPIVRLQPLLSDLRDRREGFGIESLDYLVISGDVTNRGAYEEFERVHEFLSALVREMKLTAERTILVPGNHDLSWDEEVYEWMQERKVDPASLRPGSYVRQGNGYLLRDDARYPQRFLNFARFYHQFKQMEYPLRPEAQSQSTLFEDSGIQFLALNSAWMIDEFHAVRSGVNEAALAQGLIEADRKVEEAVKAGRLRKDADVLRIAVWHHPATGNEKIADDDFIDRLRKADFELCLHGHVHEERADLVGYLHPIRKLHVAGAGSFGAVAAQRPPSTPKLYNLIEIPRDHSRIRVHTRCMRKESGTWEGWAVWPGENAFDKKAFYEIKIKGSIAQGRA
jgi:WD40 repeat protein/GTPase SAR1 family protein